MPGKHADGILECSLFTLLHNNELEQLLPVVYGHNDREVKTWGKPAAKTEEF